MILSMRVTYDQIFGFASRLCRLAVRFCPRVFPTAASRPRHGRRASCASAMLTDTRSYLSYRSTSLFALAGSMLRKHQQDPRLQSVLASEAFIKCMFISTT